MSAANGLEKTSPGFLLPGDRFYLSESRAFPDVMVRFVGWGVGGTAYVSSGPAPRGTTTMVYVCEAGYKNEIRTDIPVWRERRWTDQGALAGMDMGAYEDLAYPEGHPNDRVDDRL